MHPPLIFQTGSKAFSQRPWLRWLMLWVILGSLLARGGETSYTEYQVKSLFLLNFTKYVDWPPAAFAGTNDAFIIGVCGDGSIQADLQKTVANRTVNGRPIVVSTYGLNDDLTHCQILFIGRLEPEANARLLARLKNLPVLTVGETDNFLEQGGIIRFVKRAERVRLEINLEAAQPAQLQISSKLLSVADAVKGRGR
jgi:hypothetical protein